MSDDNDDLSSLLGGDDDDVISYFPSTSASEQPEVKHDQSSIPDYSTQMAEMQRKMEEQAAEIRRLQQIPSTHQPVQSPVQYNPQPQAPIDQTSMLKQQFESAYLADPAGAMVQMFQLAKQQAVEEARRAMYPVAGQTTRFAIDQFRNSANLRDDEKAEFDSLVGTLTEQDLANANPTMLSRQLEILKNAAKGAALEKRQNAPQPRVPTYSAHSNIPSANSGEPVRMKLSKSQKEYYSIGLENGFTPEQIMKQIREEGIE